MSAIMLQVPATKGGSIFDFQTIVRRYSSEYPVDIQMIKDRVLLVLRLYDKINPDKVNFYFGVIWLFTLPRPTFRLSTDEEQILLKIFIDLF